MALLKDLEIDHIVAQIPETADDFKVFDGLGHLYLIVGYNMHVVGEGH